MDVDAFFGDRKSLYRNRFWRRNQEDFFFFFPFYHFKCEIYLKCLSEVQVEGSKRQVWSSEAQIRLEIHEVLRSRQSWH